MDECLRHYGRSSESETCAQCQRSSVPITRCRECFQPPELCRSCQIEAHVHQPFHWVDVWSGDYFARDSLQNLGLILNIGHCGAACPAAVPYPTIPLVVVHINGVHKMSISFCRCDDGAKRYVQLLRERLFPASYEHPQTAFTFAVLADFHLHTLCSKKSAYDYYAKIVRQTSDVVPSSTSDRYREFLRACRIWMDLEATRRSGQAHGLQRLLPAFAAARIRSPLCPACPQLGINVTVNEHLVTLYLGGDGNFSLSSKKKAVDGNDTPLNNGAGFFPEQEHFQNYITTHEDFKLVDYRQPQTCSGFKTSMLFQGSLGCRSSGVYSWSCIRHGLYRPGGTVDLQVGERYVFSNVDYAFAGAISG
ncbi:hypothetical protein CALCODRAFT_435178, partial [Calocera cornea HHB12733]